MMDLRGFFLESAGHFVCTLGLAALIFAASRIPQLSRINQRRRPNLSELPRFTLFWSGLGLIASFFIDSPNFVAFFAGVYGGPLAGYCCGAMLGGWSGFTGSSTATVIFAVLAGVIGGLLPQPKSQFPLWIAFVASILGILGLDYPNSAGAWALPDLISNAAPELVALLATFSAINLAFGRLVDYSFRFEERERARSSGKVLSLVNEVSDLLNDGLTPESASQLVPRIKETLEVPGVALMVAGHLVTYTGEFPLPKLTPPEKASGIEDLGQEYQQVYWLPLDDGRDTVALLVLLSTNRQPFPAWLPDTAEGLRTLLSGWLTRLRAEEDRADLESTRFRFLQAQIRPHFLFNTLNTIASLSKSEEVRETVTNLSGFLRESFRQDQARVPLEQELRTVDRYLSIEKLRFGERLKISQECPTPIPDVALPAFTLQPLVENCVNHGIGPLEDGGEISMAVRLSDSDLVIEIRDNGVGMTKERLVQVLKGQAGSCAGIGLSNVKERLESSLGPRHDFKVESNPGGGTNIKITMKDWKNDV